MNTISSMNYRKTRKKERFNGSEVVDEVTVPEIFLPKRGKAVGDGRV
jgi:hypothetical protein